MIARDGQEAYVGCETVVQRLIKCGRALIALPALVCVHHGPPSRVPRPTFSRLRGRGKFERAPKRRDAFQDPEAAAGSFNDKI